MKFNYKTLKEELPKSGLADDGLVAIGPNNASAAFWFGAIGAAVAASKSSLYAISLAGDRLMKIPYDKNGFYVEKAESFAKEEIKSLKLCGVLSKAIKFVTNDGKKHKYTLSQGIKDAKKMVEKLALPKK